MSSQKPADSTATNERKNLKRSSEPEEQMVEDVSRPPSKTMKQNPDSEDGSNLESSVTSDEIVAKTEATPTDSERIETEALSSLGLTVGARLEVMWLLEDDDSSTEKWWGCSLAGAKTGQRDEAEGRPIFTLHYDAYQGFEEADHDVCFVDKYRLIHLEDGAEMTWKIEGQEVDRDAVLASLGDEAVDLQEVVEAQEEEDAEEGESIETQGMRALAQLPHHQQMELAAGYRRMADVVKEHLRAKMEQQQQRGGEAVVSAADIENMFRDVRAGIGGGRST